MRTRPPTTPSHALLALGATLALAPACGPTSIQEVGHPDPVAIPAPPVMQPSRPIHLRSVFDDDPTVYVGRFVPKGLPDGEVDETAATQTRCSDFYAYKVVNSSQEFDEAVFTSSKVAAAIGVKPIAELAAGKERSNALRIRYTLKKRMQVAVKDPAGLDRCCAAAPDQCSDLVIGEFLMGSGEVYQALGAKAAIEASGLAKTLGDTVTYKDDVAWKRVNTFKDTYFAFLTTKAGGTGAGPGPDDGSCSWCESIPPSPDGKYFCGVSAPAPSEDLARTSAMKNAREQVVKYLGEYITSESATHASVIEGYVGDAQFTTTAASGLASFVKDTKWCKPTTTNTPEGPRYTSKVLAFFPNAEKKKAATTTLEAMIAARSKDPKRKGDEAVLKALLKKVK